MLNLWFGKPPRYVLIIGEKMLKKYVYGGREFSTSYAVKQAIFEAERIAFGAEPSEGKTEFWAQYGVEYSEVADPVHTPTEGEIATSVREQRDRLIAETDFLMMPDYPINPDDLVAVKAYRQALRDVPQQEGFPIDVKWPESPSVLEEYHVS